MPISLFYVVRRRPSVVPGASWVLLDPPAGDLGATDGHTIGILMPTDRAGPADELAAPPRRAVAPPGPPGRPPA